MLLHFKNSVQICYVNDVMPAAEIGILLYEGESNENLKYFLSHNLLNTQGTQ